MKTTLRTRARLAGVLSIFLSLVCAGQDLRAADVLAGSERAGVSLEEVNGRSPAIAIEAMLNGLDARTSLYAKHLPTGREVAIRADQPSNTLSVIKLAIMVLAFSDAESGRLNLDQRYTLKPADYRRGSGLLRYFDNGVSLTYRDLVTQIVITSDNTATDILINTLGIDRVNALLTKLGYRQTRLQRTTGDLFRDFWKFADPNYQPMTHREVFERGWPEAPDLLEREFEFDATEDLWAGRSTARETAHLLEQVERCEILSKPSCEAMVSILSDQWFDTRLPSLIDSDVNVAHKTGDWPPITGNDVGIIYGDRGPIVIAIYASQNRGDFNVLEAMQGKIAAYLLSEWQ